MLEADRLVIYAASEKEMNQIIEAERDEELREAYGEMLRLSLENPEDWGWYAMWQGRDEHRESVLQGDPG